VCPVWKIGTVPLVFVFVIVTTPLAIVPGPAAPSSVPGVDVMSSNAAPYCAVVGSLVVRLMDSLVRNCDDSAPPDTVNST
jgi:hypothetical protein